jgi:ComF family protein
MIKYILWLLFPSRCACCNVLIEKDKHLCEDCSSKIERIKRLCTVCGSDKRGCVCKYRTYHFKGAAAPFNHGDVSKQTINNFKFRGNIEVAEFLSEEMVKSVREAFGSVKFDAVLSVPMQRLKKILVGFNQSEVLARKIAKSLGVPYKNNLKKLKRNKTQHEMSFKDRMLNVKGVYGCEAIEAENVLLVDDIKTTGATLDECARQIMFAGARNVYGVTAVSNFYKKQQLKKSK